MATIEKRLGPNGKPAYRVRIRLRGFPARSKSFTRKTDALQWAQRIESSIRGGEYVPSPEAMRRTVAEMIDRYIENTLPHKPNNKDRAKVARLLQWWRNEIGDYALANVTPAVITEARDDLQKRKNKYGRAISGGTVNRYLAAIGHAFRTAHKEWQWIERNPMLGVSRKQESKGRDRFLDDDERIRLLEACQASTSPYLYPIVILALSTGARRGELRSMTWKNVDLNRRRITFTDTKNNETRSLPLSGAAHEALQSMSKIRQIETPLVFPGRKPSQLVDFDHAFADAVAAAGIEDFRFHDLRHSAASYLAMSGASLAEIAAILGHKTLQMVKRYTHLSTEHTAQVLERMNQKFL